MDYDSNDAHDAIPNAVNYLPTTFKGPTPYIYASRDQAVSVPFKIGRPRRAFHNVPFLNT